jgi:hypothetical protein
MKINLSKRFFSVLSVLLCVVFTALACGFAGGSAPTVVTVVVTQAPGASPDAAPAIVPVTGNQAAPTATLAQQPANITRVAPPDAVGTGPSLSDSDSSVSATLNHPQDGDNFSLGLFERPFNANAQDQYFPQVDILQSSMVNGNPWVYGSITVNGADATTGLLNASYALELDTNLDGRGDTLVVVNNPQQGGWSVDGVQVFVDVNFDVGGSSPMHADSSAQGNGYDQKVFDSGQGAEPDMAWARVSSEQPNVVLFAFKSSLIGNAGKWLWGAWAQMGGLHPELFDYNDHFSADQAGNPMPGDSNYPLKTLAELDNTCRWAIGFTPNGSEPGLCPLPTGPTAEATIKPTKKPTPKPSPTPTLAATHVFPTFSGPKINKTLILKVPPFLFFSPTPTPNLKLKPILIAP